MTRSPDGSMLRNLLRFARALRAAGVSVRALGVTDAVRALDLVGVSSKADVRDALRAALVFRHEDFRQFDELFEGFWRVWPDSRGRLPQPMQTPRRVRSSIRLLAPSATSAEYDDRTAMPRDHPIVLGTYSPDEIVERWRQKDFATFTKEDESLAAAALAKLVWNPGIRLTRRWVSGPSAGRSRVVDLRRLLRVNRNYGTEILSIPYRVRRVAPRPLIFFCDISGSMEPYTRMLLLFAHAISGGARRVEVFLFSTRLTRVTRQFAEARVEAALSRVKGAVHDWSGGTRIGEAIRAFNVRWERRVLSHRPVFLLISDGWDLGDPDLLAREIARLQRNVFRLVWLNPLIGSPGYEPLTRGMRAALPFVDDFLPVHNMASLESLAMQLNTLSGSPTRQSRPAPAARARAERSWAPRPAIDDRERTPSARRVGVGPRGGWSWR